METFFSITRIIDTNIFLYFIPMLISIWLAKVLFKNRFETNKALNVVSWIIIIYTIITGMMYLYGLLFIKEGYAFTNRATGPYWFAYWMMLLGNLVLPLTLFFKKLRTKVGYLIFVSFAMKSGTYFEKFVIFITKIHRDFDSEGVAIFQNDPFLNFIKVIFIQGCVLAIILLGYFEIRKAFKIKSTT